MQPSFYNNLELAASARQEGPRQDEAPEKNTEVTPKLQENKIKQFSFDDEVKEEIKKELLQPDNISSVSFQRKDSEVSKSSETPSNLLRLSFNNEDKKDKTLLKKFINLKNESKN